MKNIVVKSVLSTALLAAAGVSFAQPGSGNAFGIVISATPVVQQVTVPKQVCTTTHVQHYQPGGGGAVIGALVGGALGNQIGRGHGQDSRAIATVVGALGGGFVGNQIEANNGYYTSQPTQQCHTQNTVENRTIAQNVLYEYAGQRYTVQMPATGDFRPGVRIALQVQNQVAPAAPVTQVYAPQPAYTQPVQTVTYVQPAPTVVYYDTYDSYRPRYIYNSTPYYSHQYAPRYAPRVVSHPVHTVRPAHPVRPVHHGVHHGYRHDDYRNWR
jgi:uncharacterized protein YcfJ